MSSQGVPGIKMKDWGGDLGNAWNSTVGVFGENLRGAASYAWDKTGGALFEQPDKPKLQSPDALSAPPTAADASTTQLQNQLSREKNALSTSTYLTGGVGLLEQPTTTSSILLGN